MLSGDGTVAKPKPIVIAGLGSVFVAFLLVGTAPVWGRTYSVPATAMQGVAERGHTPLMGQPASARFAGEVASGDTRRVTDWVVTSHDNHDLPFVIIDKAQAKVFVFDSDGQLQGATFALLGMAHGDDSVPGIGNRKLSTIRPDERFTPAGRFVASLGRDFEQDLLWVDYGTSVSLHRVVTGAPSDHRRERLATKSALDKRITYGCINVPPVFYDGVIRKAFTGTVGIVYILPEVKAITDVFPITDVGAPLRQTGLAD
jgi:hypothetical protein